MQLISNETAIKELLVKTSWGGEVTRDEITFCWNCGAKFDRSVCHV